MKDKAAYYRLRSGVENSSRILILLLTFSAFGVLFGISSIIYKSIWINIPNHYPVLILLTSMILLAVSYLIYRNTRRLAEALQSVYTYM